MDYNQFCGALKLRSNSSLRNSLDIQDFEVSYDKKATLTQNEIKEALLSLIANIEIITEMMRRLWDEFEGHQDACRGYKVTHNCPYLDDEAEDGWLTTDAQEELKKFTEGFAYKPPHLRKEEQMDKLIKKVEKDVKKGAKGKAMKDIKTLKHADKKFDKKIEKAKKVMKKGC